MSTFLSRKASINAVSYYYYMTLGSRLCRMIKKRLYYRPGGIRDYTGIDMTALSVSTVVMYDMPSLLELAESIKFHCDAPELPNSALRFAA